MHAVIGGAHERWGTHNSLYYAGLSYVEFLGIQDREKAAASNNPLIQLLSLDLLKGEGFGQPCIRTNNIEKIKCTLHKKGLKTTEILDASRKRSDGNIIRWRMLFVKQEGFQRLPLPFFIQWHDDDQARLKDLQTIGSITPHNLQVTITAVYFVVRNVQESAKQWSELLDIKYNAQQAVDKRWGGTTEILYLKDVAFCFIQPDGNSFLHHILEQKGERPFALALKMPNAPVAEMQMGGGQYIFSI